MSSGRAPVRPRVSEELVWRQSIHSLTIKIWGVEIEKEGQELSESKNGSSNYLGAVK